VLPRFTHPETGEVIPAASLANPHGNARVFMSGTRLDETRGAVILVHGRGASASSILELGDALTSDDLTLLAPEAVGHTWYPRSFLSPLADNEPYLSSALGVLGQLVDGLIAQGIEPDRIAFAGFSQGACLAAEFMARNARRFAGLCAFSGGLIGPPGTSRDYEGSLEGTPVFLGCSDDDPHVPVERVHETAEVLTRLGAQVTTRIYPGMGHTIIPDEIDEARGLLAEALD
jgi:predicted esterase